MALEHTGEESARLWRRQAVLVVLTAAMLVVALVLVAVMVDAGNARPGRWLADGTPAPQSSVRSLTIAVMLAAAAAFVLLAASIVHAARVVTFTFHKREH